tara:strand:+ start:41886 stop:43229 length:1344 start_codon:yes stop_codon:yes gene_type:complete
MSKKLFPFITILLILFLVEVVGQLSSFAVSNNGQAISNTKIKNTVIEKNKKRVLCLGESTTEGGYPIVLQDIFNNSITPGYQVIDHGYDAVNTDFFKLNIEKIYELSKPDYAVLMMGINDRFHISSAIKVNRSPYQRLFLYKLGLYFADLFSTDSADEKLVRLLNAKRIDEAKDLFLSDYKELENIELIQVAFEVVGDHLPERSFDLKLLEIYNFMIDKFPKETQFRIDRLWVYEDLDDKKSIEEEARYLESIKGQNHLLAVFFFNAYRDFDRTKGYLLKAYANNEKLDTDSKELFIRLLGEEEIEKTKRIISTLTEEEKTKVVPALKKFNYGKANKMKLDDLISTFDKNQFSPKTLSNILYVANYLKSKGVKVIISQYPLRSTKIFESTNFDDFKVISNKNTFLQALNEKSYDEVFQDSFGGDFGHMTFFGKTILAKKVYQNIVAD